MDDGQEDCTVYIEELKSDNPSLKLNAAGKITAIASVLGHNRMRDELIPYLIEIIEEMDNDNDFLVKVAEQLIELKPLCRDISQTHILIPPLKILAALDQPVVRERAVVSLQKLAEGQPKAFFKKHYFNLIKEMAAEQAYPSRVSVCGLVPICYPQVQADLQSDLRQIFNKLALNQDIPMVRRCLAENLEPYVKVIAKNMARTEVLQIWQKFIQDGIDIVRIKALEVLPIVAEFFKKEEMFEKFVRLVKIVDKDKDSWRIRYALAEAWTTILDKVEKDTLKKDIVQSFQELLKDKEHEVRSVAVLKLPDLARKLTASQSTTAFLPHMERLVKDTSQHVRQAVVESLVPFLTTIQKEKLLTTGITIIEQLLKDEAMPVRIGLIEKLKNLHDLLGTDSVKKHIIPIIMSCQEDKKWRFRLSVVENLPTLFRNLGYDSFKDSLQPLLKGFLKDHYYAVREQTFNTFSKMKDAFGPEKSRDLIVQSLTELSKENNFVYRVAACQGLAKCANALDKKDLSDVFTDFARRLDNDKVPNVLINLIKCYMTLKNTLSVAAKKEWILTAKRLKQNRDEDVAYFASKSQQ